MVFLPIHFPVQGQWWSHPSTQIPHSIQWEISLSTLSHKPQGIQYLYLFLGFPIKDSSFLSGYPGLSKNVPV